MLLRIAAVAALGGFLFGYDLGLIGGAMLGISRAFNITSNSTKELIVGAAKFGAFLGTFLGGMLMLRYGRRLAIAWQSLFFVLGPFIMALAAGPAALVVGRLVVGLGVGASAIVVPAYLAEIAPAKQRGAIVQMYEMMLTLGMLSAVLVDALLSATAGPGAWRWMVGLPALPGAAMAASLVLLPESPRWLVLRGRLDAALSVLQHVLAGAGGRQGSPSAAATLAAAEDELLLLWSSVEQDKAAVLARRELLLLRCQYYGGGQPPTGPATAAGVGAALAGPGGSGMAAGVAMPSGGGVSHALAANGTASPAAALVVVPPPAGAQQAQHRPEVELQMFPTHQQQQHQQQQQQGNGQHSIEDGMGPSGPLPTTDGRRTTFGSDDSDAEELQHTDATAAGASTSSRGRELQPLGSPTRRLQGRKRGSPSREAGPAEEQLLPRTTLGSSRHQQRSSSGSPSRAGRLGRSGSSSPSPNRSSPRHKGATAAAKATLRSWWQQQQQQGWLPPGSSNGHTAAAASAAGGSAPDSSSTPAAGDGSRSSLSGAAYEPGQEPTALHTLWAMLGEVYVVAKGPERRAFFMAIVLAVFNQATASTAVINYAPEVLAAQLRVTEESNAILYPAVISLTKCVGVGIALSVVDDLGRRPLLIAGGAGCAVSLWAAAAALGAASVTGFLASLCLFIFCFSLSWAGLYWVVVSEIFSMTVKSPASSAATSLLFLTGSLVDLVFLSLMGALGRWAFVLFGLVALASAAYVWRSVPETKGKTLAEVQAVLAGSGGGGGTQGNSNSSAAVAAAAGAASGGIWPTALQQQHQQHHHHHHQQQGAAFLPVYSLGEDSPRAGVVGEQVRLLGPSGLGPQPTAGAAAAATTYSLGNPANTPTAAAAMASGTGAGARGSIEGSPSQPASGPSPSAVEQSYLQQAWVRQQQQQLSGGAGGGLLLPLGAELQPGRGTRHGKP